MTQFSKKSFSNIDLEQGIYFWSLNSSVHSKMIFKKLMIEYMSFIKGLFNLSKFECWTKIKFCTHHQHLVNFSNRLTIEYMLFIFNSRLFCLYGDIVKWWWRATKTQPILHTCMPFKHVRLRIFNSSCNKWLVN